MMAPQPWEPALHHAETGWVKLLNALGPAFPQAVDSEDEWTHFVAYCFRVPAVVAVAGFIAAVSVLFMGCCCGRRHRYTFKPSSIPPVVIAITTVVVICVGSACFWGIAKPGAKSMGAQLDRAIDDTKEAYDMGVKIEQMATSLQGQLDGLSQTCPLIPDALVKKYVDPMKEQLKQLGDTVGTYVHEAEPIVTNMTDFKHGDSNKVLSVLNTVAVVPLAFTLLCVVATFLGVCVTRMARGSGQCAGCCLKTLGPLFFAPTILLVAICSSTEFGVSIAASSFCASADSNFLNVVEHLSSDNSTVYQVSDYYVTGYGHNPLLDELQNARTQLTSIDEQVKLAKPISVACPHFDYDKVVNDLNTTDADVERAQQLLERSNIYPYYDEVVHKSLCTDVVTGLGWLVVFQVLVSILLLPLLIGVGDRFLTIRYHWQLEQARDYPIATQLVNSRV